MNEDLLLSPTEQKEAIKNALNNQEGYSMHTIGNITGKALLKAQHEKTLGNIKRKLRVINSYGDMVIRGCDWQKLNGLDFEGNPEERKKGSIK